MDPDNPIVKLCAEGMAAEGEGRPEDARALFLQAWDRAANDYEASIAAHYAARHQESAEERLHWNRVAVERADRSEDDEVRLFYPSLYLNLAHSYEETGDRGQAVRYYNRAAACLDDLPPGPYTDLVRRGVSAGIERTGGKKEEEKEEGRK